jgi:hypothetical protein
MGSPPQARDVETEERAVAMGRIVYNAHGLPLPLKVDAGLHIVA